MNRNRRWCQLRDRSRAAVGFVLIEALAAIVIVSIGIVALVGAQAFAVKTAAETNYRAEAAFLANQIIGTMWGDLGSVGAYATLPNVANAKTDAWKVRVALLPAGTGQIDVAGSQVTVIVRWQSPGGDQHNYRVAVDIEP